MQQDEERHRDQGEQQRLRRGKVHVAVQLRQVDFKGDKPVPSPEDEWRRKRCHAPEKCQDGSTKNGGPELGKNDAAKDRPWRRSQSSCGFKDRAVHGTQCR